MKLTKTQQMKARHGLDIYTTAAQAPAICDAVKAFLPSATVEIWSGVKIKTGKKFVVVTTKN